MKRNSMTVNIYKIPPLHDIDSMKNSKSSFSDFSYIIVVHPPSLSLSTWSTNWRVMLGNLPDPPHNPPAPKYYCIL